MREATKWIMWIGLFLFVLWDAFAASKENESTITVELRKTAKSFPILPFTVGVLMGHLWWN
jgi:hypothetical protein